MKTKQILHFIIIFFLGGALSACTGGAFVSSSWPGITVDEDTAYVAYNQHVYAVNLSNGNEKWRYPGDADNKKTFYAAPALSTDGQLIVGSYDHKLYSINPDNGQEKWSGPKFKDDTIGAKDRFIGAPLATEAGIFAPSADKNLYAVDKDGGELWSFPADEPLWAMPATDDSCGCVFLSSMDHHVYSIDAQSGEQNWKSEDLGGAIVGTPAIDSEDKLYAGTFGNEMVALDSHTGRTLWRYKTENWVWSGPAISNEVLYFGDLSGNIYAINASDGSELWKKKPDNKVVGYKVVGTPLVIDDMIIFTTELDTVYAVDLEGNPLWSQVVGGKIYSSPVAAGDLILVAPIESDSLLVALANNGTQKWKFTPEQ